MGEGIVVGGHAVDARHGAERAGIVVGATVAHHAHGAHRQERHEGLPDLVVEPVAADLVDIDRIGPAQDLELLAGDLAGAADREAGAGEGMAADEALGQAELAAEGADLVLEEFAQRLDQLQTHLLGQAAHIVVRLDRDRGTAREAHRLDHVWIERALREEGGAAHVGRMFLEHVDEEPADGLALHFRVRDTLERAEEEIGLVGMDQRHVVMVAEHLDHLLGLAEAQQAVVDEDAGQLIADGLVDQHRCDRTVDAAREAADHLLVAHLGPDPGDRLLAVGPHRPVALEAREAHEILVELRALRRVVHLGVELHRIEMARGIAGDGEGRVGRGAEHLKARRDLRDMVAVAHPDLLAALLEPAVEDRQTLRRGGHEGAAEFGGAVAAFDLAAEAVHHHLLAVADPEDRHAEVEHARGGHRRALGEDRGRAAGEDDGLRSEALQEGFGHVLIGMDLAVDIQLAQAARDELGHLRPEIDDEETVVLGHGVP
mgnify:CR=1 FL=1